MSQLRHRTPAKMSGRLRDGAQPVYSDDEEEGEGGLTGLEPMGFEDPQQRAPGNRRSLLIAIGVLSTILLVFVIAVAIKVALRGETTSTMNSGGTVCTTPECVLAGAEVLNTIDGTVDPCDDFFNYACKRWLDDNPIPDEQPQWNRFGHMAISLRHRLKNILDSKPGPTETTEASSVFRTMRAYYTACMGEEAVQRMGAAPLDLVLEPIEQWEKGILTHERLIAAMHEIDINVPWAVGVSTDDRNSSGYVLQLSQDGLGLPSKEYYAKDIVVAAYVEFTARMLDLAQVTDKANATAAAKAVVSFEQQLASITIPNQDLRDPDLLYNPHTLPQLQALTSGLGFDWASYLAALPLPLVPDKTIVATPTFFQKLAPIVQGLSNQTLALYYKAAAIRSYARKLSSEFVEEIDKLDRLLSGATPKPRWQRCVLEIDGLFKFVLGRLYVATSVDARTKPAAEAMVVDIRAAMSETLKEVEWMDPQTSEKAQEKLAVMSEKIGYPDNLMNDTWLIGEYKDFKADVDFYFRNAVNCRKVHNRKQLKKLGTLVDKTEWAGSPADVNAFYNPPNNDITFPAAILNAPFFSPLYPPALNYGAMGMVIGHEMTHGFDDSGRKYDKNGEVEPNGWWANSVVDAFTDKAKCFENQYASYTVRVSNGTQIPLNGVLTLGENIADNGGLRQAWRAYRRHVETSETQAMLPGVSLSHDQLFFLAYARAFCGHSRPQYAEKAVLIDPHSPARERILGVLSNMPEFSAAFQCSNGAAYNRQTKCRIW